MIAVKRKTPVLKNPHSGNMKKLSILILCFSFNSLCSQNPATRIYTETDQPFYFSGQTMSVGYHLYDFDFTPNSSSEIVYFQLKDKGNNTVSLHKQFANKGAGNISIDLPKNLATGYYELITYTNFMLNFDLNFLNRIRIPIYNINDSLNNRVNEVIATPSMNFYIEGGNMIENISTRIAFEFDHDCKNTQAELKDDKGKIILSIHLTNLGVGSFFLRPEKSRTYSVYHSCDSLNKYNYQLPPPENNGLAFSIYSKSKELQLVVQSRNRFMNNDTLVIRGYSDYSLVYESKGIIRKNGLLANILKEILPNGSIDFFILDQKLNVLAKRSIYKDIQLDSTDILAKDHYTTSSMSEFQVTDQRPLSNMTAQIIPEEWFECFMNSNRLYYLENPPINYFNQLSKNQIVKYFDEMSIINSKYEVPPNNPNEDYTQFRLENNLFLRGILQDHKSLPDSASLYFFIPEVNVIYQSRLDSTGKFEIPLLFEFYGSQKIPFYVYSENHEFQSPKIVSSRNDLNIKSDLMQNPVGYKFLQEFKTDLLRKEKYESIHNYYNPKKKEKTDKLVFDIHSLIEEYDAEYVLDEFTSFSTMEETIKEILNGLMLRKRKGENILRIFSKDLLEVYKETPFIFINNSPTREVNDLLSLNPKEVDKIQIVSSKGKLLQMGPFGDGGLIIVDLKPGVTLKKSQQGNYFDAVGLSTPTQLDKNVSSTLGIPDLSSNLYWNPSLKAENGDTLTVNFKTSDRPGNYRIIVKSLHDDGSISYGTKKIRVEFKGTGRLGDLNSK